MMVSVPNDLFAIRELDLHLRHSTEEGGCISTCHQEHHQAHSRVSTSIVVSFKCFFENVPAFLKMCCDFHGLGFDALHTFSGDFYCVRRSLYAKRKPRFRRFLFATPCCTRNENAGTCSSWNVPG